MEAQAQTEPVPSKTSALLQQQLCEAALYVSGRPLDFKTIGSVIGARSEEKIRSVARAIAERYAKIDSPIQVLELPDGRFVMQLRPEFVKNVRKLSNRPLLTPGPLRTLSFIALRQPISQSHVVRVRGKLAYQHVKQLKEMDLISYDKDRLGRSRVLRTTITFADYFNLNHDPVLMKKELKNVLDLTNQPQTQTAEVADSTEESAS
jgi:segregation and condensation protein B